MRQGDEQDRSQSPSSSSLPSIRELFGIRTGDNLHTLVTSPSRPARSTQPPPSSFPQQGLQIPDPNSPELRHTTPGRSHSFSSGQVVDGNHAGRGRRSSPSARSAAASPPYTTSPQQATPRSARYPHSSHSPSNVGSQLLPPLSTAVPEILPINRMRAVSDSEAIARGTLSPSSSSTRGGSTVRPPPQAPFLDYAAVKHPSLRTDANVDSVMDQRRHVGRSTVQPPSGAHYPSPSSSTRISHSHSIITSQSSGASDDPEQSLPWSASRSSSSSRNAPDYPSPSSALEYSPHPFSSASVAARQGTNSTQYTSPAQHHHLGHGGTPSSSLSPGYHGIEGQVHTSPSRGSERAPPSSFPQHGHSTNSHGSGNRPRSGNSSEGDETKSGFGKYECEYCSKRFNRPSSLRIHINTHTGAKPFQCPFPNCGRRFSVMSNMRRHARTHGTLLAPSSSADDENGASNYQDGPADGGPSPSQRPASSQLPMSAESSFNGRERHELNRNWPESSMEIDELEDEEDEEMDTDGGGGSSESESYPQRRNSVSAGPVHPSIKFGMLAKIRTDA